MKRFPNSIPKKTNIAVNDKHYSECVGSVKRTAVIQTEGTTERDCVGKRELGRWLLAGLDHMADLLQVCPREKYWS